ncbi:MAG: hypothetical protein, partial [Olavius algarvensis Gamma 1 endosymbiont]
SIPAAFMVWFLSSSKAIRIVTWFPDPGPSSTDLMYAG